MTRVLRRRVAAAVHCGMGGHRQVVHRAAMQTGMRAGGEWEPQSQSGNQKSTITKALHHRANVVR